MKGGDDGIMRKRAKEYKNKELEDMDISFNNACCEDTQL